MSGNHERVWNKRSNGCGNYGPIRIGEQLQTQDLPAHGSACHPDVLERNELLR